MPSKSSGATFRRLVGLGVAVAVRVGLGVAEGELVLFGFPVTEFEACVREGFVSIWQAEINGSNRITTRNTGKNGLGINVFEIFGCI
jgi:hypothetical protein